MDYLNQFPSYTQSGWSSRDGGVPYLALTISFTLLVFALEITLDLRQLSSFYTRGDKISKELEKVVPDETFRKSIAYGKDKFRFKIVESVFSIVSGIAFMLLGYLPYTWDLSTKAADYTGVTVGNGYSSIFSEVVVTWLFVVLLTLVDTVVSFPFSLYSTFVVEQKHGFNKSSFGLFMQDKAMTLGLTFLLSLPVLSIVVWLVRVGGPYFYFYVWLFLCVIGVVLMTVYPTLIAPLFNKYTKLEDGEIKDAIEDLAQKVSFPLTQVFCVDGSKRSAHSNAYFYGFFKVVQKELTLMPVILTLFLH